MKLVTTLLAVEDIKESRKFYEKIFNQKVILDFGENISFEGGLALQEKFDKLVDIPKDSIIKKSNNIELYFEVDDFDSFMNKLRNYKNIKYVNPPKTHSWKQRVVRIYDPDFHIIEIGESMSVIAKRYVDKGLSVDKTAELIQHPVDFVNNAID